MSKHIPGAIRQEHFAKKAGSIRRITALLLCLCLICVLFSQTLPYSFLSRAAASNNDHDAAPAAFTVINPHKGYQYNYKGNLHAHSNKPGGGPDPPAVVGQWYKDNGYGFYAITDHDYVNSDPGVGGIVWLGGGEEDSRDGSSGHMGLINISTPVSSGSDQARINNAQSQGGIIILHHANRSTGGWSNSSVASLDNYLGIEIYNGGGIDSTSKWDFALSAGKSVWGIASDDSHWPASRGTAYIVVNSSYSSPTKNEILSQITSGNFYASRGCDLTVTVAGNTISAQTTNGSKIKWIKQFGHAIKVTQGNSDTFTPSGDEGYVRIEILDSAGASKAWSQPLTISSDIEDADVVFVTSLYQSILEREPDSIGLARWVYAIKESALSRTQIATAFIGSHEYHTNFVNDLYLEILNRSPDTPGLNAWVNALDSGMQEKTIVAAFYGSEEYYNYCLSTSTVEQYVTTLYQSILEREPDCIGQANWVYAIKNGSFSRTQVATAFIGSHEYHTNFVNDLYLEILNRSPDTPGLNAWVNALNSGIQEKTIVAAFYGSEEYYNELCMP